MSSLFKIQGVFVNPEEVSDKIALLVEQFGNFWPHYRGEWVDQNDLGPERVFSCVQCGEDYQESKNASGSCSFHSGVQEYRGQYSCCNGTGKGCTRSRHRAQHHQDYAYELFGAWTSQILWKGLGDSWLKVESDNYEG